MAFRGTFDHTLDAKNRLTVPAKFRAALAEGVVLVRGVEPCLAVWPVGDYTIQTDTALAGLNPFSPEARELKRIFFGSAFDTELDAAGRVMLPAKFNEHAGLGHEVVIAGMGECLEVWDRGAWASHDADLAARAADLTAALGRPG